MSLTHQEPEVRAEQADAAIESCRQRVFAQALRCRNRPEDAEDIAQDAAVRLVRWPHLAQCPSARWVAQLTRHCTVAHAKMHRPHAALEEELVSTSEPVAELDRARIQSALAQLSAREAQLVLLRYELGWSSSVIAEALGMTVAAVRMGTFRARNRLRCALIDLIGSC